MYFSVVLVVALNFQFAIAFKHTSALVKRGQTLPSGPSTEIRIKCAVELIQSNRVGAKIAEGADTCELLSFSEMTSFEPGYEYLEKATVIDSYSPPVIHFLKANFKETTMYVLFSEVMVGDKFQFVTNKTNTDKFSIAFRDAGKTTMLTFEAQSNQLTLKDGYENVTGEVDTPQYPFSDFKEYKIVFHVLETHWQVDIDDVAFTTFEHRRPFDMIKKIQVKVGPAVTFLTKASDPRLS